MSKIFGQINKTTTILYHTRTKMQRNLSNKMVKRPAKSLHLACILSEKQTIKENIIQDSRFLKK